MSAPSSVPVSPASSKRSRSKDSARSAAASTPTLLPPIHIAPHAAATAADPDPTPYPVFLRPASLDRKWNDLEWAQMTRLRDATPADPEAPAPWARCSGEAYAARNRYLNVDPYQANRVRLEVPEGASDYINASPITLASTKTGEELHYIATQGPKADSWAHMWRMIWQQTQSPAVIVMVTKTHEQGREKCFPYFPTDPENPVLPVNPHDEFADALTHDLRLDSLSDSTPGTQLRNLTLSHPDGTALTIHHLLFSAWPDFSVPEDDDRSALLALITLSRELNSTPGNPRIVHCSAGIGRSGTFIALDWLLQELDEGSLDDVPPDADPILTLIENLRDQRPMMVQSKQQFVFIYDTLRERWRERWIAQNPEHAASLGVSPRTDDGPRLKRVKSHKDQDTADADGDVDVDTDTDTDADVDAHFATPTDRAKLEAELMAADYE